MKIFSTLFLLLTCSVSFAGYGSYGGVDINEYDISSGLYYKSIHIKRENKRFLSSSSNKKVVNIGIYNPETDKHHTLFKNNIQHEISFILFEQAVKDSKVVYNSQSYNIKNNHVSADRLLKNKLLIGISDAENEKIDLWIAEKNGDNLKKLTSIPFSARWHIDVKNSKLRVVYANNGQFRLTNYDW